MFPDLEELTLWNYSRHNYLVGAGKVFPDLEELTLWNYSRHNYLVGAGKVFPDLEELTLWNFDSDWSRDSPFHLFSAWDTFSKLHTLKLNNLSFCHLLIIIQ